MNDTEKKAVHHLLKNEKVLTQRFASCPGDKSWGTNWSHVNELVLNMKAGKRPARRGRASHLSLDPSSLCTSTAYRYLLCMALDDENASPREFAAGWWPLAAQRP